MLSSAFVFEQVILISDGLISSVLAHCFCRRRFRCVELSNFQKKRTDAKPTEITLGTTFSNILRVKSVVDIILQADRTLPCLMYLSFTAVYTRSYSDKRRKLDGDVTF